MPARNLRALRMNGTDCLTKFAVSFMVKGSKVRLPEWITTRGTGKLHNTKKLLRSHRLSTVCEEARCPNIGECFSKPSAAFLILGSKCTRNCGFCSVDSSAPEPVDREEPARIAMAAREMGLRYIVITSVTRDDLHDGGASHFAGTVAALRTSMKKIRIEVLTPDFKGNLKSLGTVLNSGPDVFNHNVETVPRLSPIIRPHADYSRSLSLIAHAKKVMPMVFTKSGLMLGFGEKLSEVMQVLRDLRNSGCDIITIGQYLRPTRYNLPVVEYVRPGIFESLQIEALRMGFRYVASAPLVRSSMNAEEMYNS